MKARTEQFIFGLTMGASIGVAIGTAFGDPLLGALVGLGVGGTYCLLWPVETLQEGMTPFTLSATSFGLLEHRGEVFLEGDLLVFHLRCLLGGVENKKQQVVKIEPQALEYVRMDKGQLNDAIYIKPKSTDLLAAVPGKHEDELRLSISRQHRAQSEDLVASLRNMLFGRVA